MAFRKWHDGLVQISINSVGQLLLFRHGVPVIRGGPHDVTHEYQRGGAKDFRKPGGLNKAKPKVLKPGSPEHTKAMAEMEAIKAGKPKSTNPAGEEHPSAAGSRDKLGDRPLVAFDKADGLNKYEEVPTEKIGGKMGGGSKQTSRVPELPNPVSRDMRDVKKNPKGIDKQALQTAAERAGAGLRGGQSAPAASTAASGFGVPKFGGINDKRSGNTGAAPPPVKSYKGIDPKHHAAYDKFIAEGAVTKSMDLEEGSRSWAYQG